jgi:hypothetical protein
MVTATGRNRPKAVIQMAVRGWVRARPSRVIVQKRLNADSDSSPALCWCARAFNRLDSSNGPATRARFQGTRSCSRTKVNVKAISENLGEEGTCASMQPMYELD